jgi:ureidoacrylate peracid hydrolase
MRMKKDLLIVVDYQNDFVSEDGKIAKRIKIDLSKLQKIQNTIQKLIDIWHKENKPILFIMNDYNTKYYKGDYKKFRATKSAYGNTALNGTWGHELYKIKKDKKDKVLIKHFFDGFYKTRLDEFLKKNKIENIYFAGVNTDVCVFHTSLGAVIRGYKVNVIEDATATVSDKNKKIFLDYLNKYTGINIINSKGLIK